MGRIHLFLNFVPQNFDKEAILIIGRASFHIFLLQILFFGLNGTIHIMEFIKGVGVDSIFIIKIVTFITILVINIGGGAAWFLMENRIVWKKV